MGSSRRKAGVLGLQVEGYRAWLLRRGYTPGTIRNMLKDLGQVGLWLSGAGLEASAFPPPGGRVDAGASRARGRWCRC